MNTYKIFYFLKGGNNKNELSCAHTIYEFKSSLVLLGKAIDQNDKNINYAREGAFKSKSNTTKVFRTCDSTKKVILIGDSEFDTFNGLFVEPKDVHRSIENLVKASLNPQFEIRSIFKLVERNINKIDELIKTHDNIYILNNDLSVSNINDSKLLQKFIDYKNKYYSFDNKSDKINFLIQMFKFRNDERQKFIDNQVELLNLQKKIKFDKFIEQLSKQFNIKYKFKKAYVFIDLMKYLKDMVNDDKEKFLTIYDDISKIKNANGRKIFDVYEDVQYYIKNSGKIGNEKGDTFEKQIRDNDKIKNKVVEYIDNLKPGEHKTYFNYTGGISDIDMAVIKIE